MLTAGRLHAAMQAAAVGRARAAATAVWSDEGLGSGAPQRWEATGIRMSLPAFTHIVACVRAHTACSCCIVLVRPPRHSNFYHVHERMSLCQLTSQSAHMSFDYLVFTFSFPMRS